MNDIIYDKEFYGIDYTTTKIKNDYESCIFTNCNFSEISLRSFRFTECEFMDCDLSNAKIDETAFQDIQFINCKLLGLKFDSCSPFLLTFNFINCNLNFTSFYQLKIEKTIFKNCKMHEIDFAETNLSNAVFDNCDLSKSVFENSNLSKVNFISSYNFDINPELNILKKAKFSKENVIGLLSSYNIEIT